MNTLIIEIEKKNLVVYLKNTRYYDASLPQIFLNFSSSIKFKSLYHDKGLFEICSSYIFQSFEFSSKFNFSKSSKRWLFYLS